MNWYKKATTNPNEIMFDPIKGIGNTPNNQDVDFLGYKELMYPQDFRDLVLQGVSNEETAEFAMQSVRDGKKFANPMLYKEWIPEENKWAVVGHEGRSRSIAFENLFPNQKMEVHVILRNVKPENVTPEMKNALTITESEMEERAKIEKNEPEPQSEQEKKELEEWNQHLNENEEASRKWRPWLYE